MYSLNCFISQPMKNKTPKQIKNEREEVMDRLDYFKEKVGKGELQDENTDRKIECKEEIR